MGGLLLVLLCTEVEREAAAGRAGGPEVLARGLVTGDGPPCSEHSAKLYYNMSYTLISRC